MQYIRSFIIILSLWWCTGCASTRIPIPPGVIPEPQPVLAVDEQYGQQVLSQLSNSYKLDRSDARINRVRDIVDRLAHAAGADRNPWNVYVFADDKFKNAAATRGNFIFVWTGILNTVKNDSELAAILAHEMGHVLAGHTKATPDEEARQIGTGVAGQIAGTVISAAGPGYDILGTLGELIVRASLQALLVNPEQQRQELEADQIGLYLMADARYDPSKATEFWKRVEVDPDFQGAPLEFLSSHPSSGTRLQKLEELLPDAMKRYKSPPRVKKKKDTLFLKPKKEPAEAPASPTLASPPNTDSLVSLSPSKICIIKEGPAHVFQDTDTHSPIVGKLQRGTHAVIRDEWDRFFRINDPVIGFILKRSCE